MEHTPLCYTLFYLVEPPSALCLSLLKGIHPKPLPVCLSFSSRHRFDKQCTLCSDPPGLPYCSVPACVCVQEGEWSKMQEQWVFEERKGKEECQKCEKRKNIKGQNKLMMLKVFYTEYGDVMKSLERIWARWQGCKDQKDRKKVTYIHWWQLKLLCEDSVKG